MSPKCMHEVDTKPRDLTRVDHGLRHWHSDGATGVPTVFEICVGFG